MYKIIISQPLKKLTNNITEVTIDGDSYFNLYTNLTNLFQDFKKCTDQLKFNPNADTWLLVDGKMLPKEHIFFRPKKNAEIVLVPLIAGGGDSSSLLFIGLGLAIIAITVLTLGSGTVAAAGASSLASAAVGGEMVGTAALAATGSSFLLTSGISLGLNLVLTGIMGALKPGGGAAPKVAGTSGLRGQNDAFEGLRNTTSTQTAVPLIYGQHRVAGQFIDGKIKTINHDKDTKIMVSSYV